MKKWFLRRLVFCTVLFCLVAINAFADQKDLGALSPDKALEYIKAHPHAVLVDVATKEDYAKQHYPHAISIPLADISESEATDLYKKLPDDRPVIIHGRGGLAVHAAYSELKSLRSDIPEIGYIDGMPVFVIREAK